MDTQFQGESNATQELLPVSNNDVGSGELRDGTGTRPLRKGFKLAWQLNDNGLDLQDTKV